MFGQARESASWSRLMYRMGEFRNRLRAPESAERSVSGLPDQQCGIADMAALIAGNRNAIELSRPGVPLGAAALFHHFQQGALTLALRQS